MEIKPTKVLLIEENVADAKLITDIFSRGKTKSFELEHVNQLADGIERLGKNSYEIIMLNVASAEGQGLEGFKKIKTIAPTLPVIVLTTAKDEPIGQQAVSDGAQDYWIKDRQEAIFLTSALRYSMKRKQVQTAKEDFFGTVSHEIFTPIAIAREGVSQLLDGLCGDINEEQKRQLTIVLKNIDWLKGIVTDLLKSK